MSIHYTCSHLIIDHVVLFYYFPGGCLLTEFFLAFSDVVSHGCLECAHMDRSLGILSDTEAMCLRQTSGYSQTDVPASHLHTQGFRYPELTKVTSGIMMAYLACQPDHI